MSPNNLRNSRSRLPELETDYHRRPALGYDPKIEDGLIRCLKHGDPTPLTRWHYHEEYELQIILETSGNAFVGDFIGAFSPGHVVLCGPHLPHNWIAADLKSELIDNHRVIQFLHTPIVKTCQEIPELKQILPLLDHARHGIELFNFADEALKYWHAIQQEQGLLRLASFLELMGKMAAWTNYRLLSNVAMKGISNGLEFAQINKIVSRVTENPAEHLSAAHLSAELNMSESRFSRFFQRLTGNTYTDFVNQVRINRSCQLLMNTDRYIANIGYEVGFNNIANFNRQFLKIKGLTPSEFRNRAATRFGTSHLEQA